MGKLPASTGWAWVKQGFGLFRKQPGGLATLFLAYFFLMVALGQIPVLGQILPVIMVPAFMIAFMQACSNIEQGKRVLPKLLLSGFRMPAFPALFALGVLYVTMAALAIGASTLVDDGVFWKMVSGQIDQKSPLLKDANIGGALLLAIAVYIPAAMAFFFAAPLIYWQKMGLGKALFFSFFAVLRSAKAVIVLLSAWFGISILVSQLLLIIFGRGELAIQVMIPLSVIMTVILHCSCYASYRQIFGAPEAPVSLDKTNAG
ncbi:MAG TPA: hypothetical protein DCW29_04315 [Janthinobacterium sp.]|nr:hypothetical protein [Janthinobacterium sp.]